jgi:hypothetical protein
MREGGICMGKDIVIRKGVVIPRQSQSWAVRPSGDTHRHLAGIIDNFYLDELGLVMKPENDELWVYDPDIYEFMEGPYRSKETPYVKLYKNQFFIATETKFTIKRNVTFEQFFKALKKPEKEVLLMPDDDGDYYYDLGALFNVLPEDRLAKELSEVLDSSPDAESKILSIPMVDERTEQQIELEFIITELFGWTFARLSAINYEGARLEYWIDELDGRNVYRPDSENTIPLKNCYVAFAWDSEYELDACLELVYRLLYLSENPWKRFQPEVRTFIGDMLLRLRLESYEFDEDVPIFNVEFDTLESDYTVFLEREV